MTQTLKPIIFIECIAAAKAGKLHGKRLFAAQDAESLHAEVQEFLKESPEPLAEEWAIVDYQGFGKLSLGGYESLDEVSRLGLLIKKHGEAFTAYATHVGTVEATEERFLDAYRGRWNSELDYAQDLFDELYLHEVPEYVRYYIDYSAFSRDIFLDGYTSVHSSDFGVYVFSDY